MTFSTFNLIADALSPHVRKQDTNFRKAISVRKRVAIALYRLGHGASYQQLAAHFGVGASTAQDIVAEFCHKITTEVRREAIKLPRGDALHRTIADFRFMKRFPGCFGAIDGSHLHRDAPRERF